jgi:hypothetical protein
MHYLVLHKVERRHCADASLASEITHLVYVDLKKQNVLT